MGYSPGGCEESDTTERLNKQQITYYNCVQAWPLAAQQPIN